MRCTICSAPRDRLRPRQPLPSGASPPAMATSWHVLAQRWASAGNGGKEAALLELLRRNPDEKKLVFVHYRETLDHLADLLAREGFAFARFEGGLSGPDKDAAIAAFRERVPVLLCTEFGRRRPQHPVLQYADQFRRALESNGDRAAHRTHRSHRPAARGLRVQSRDPRHAGGADLHLLEEKISMFELVVGEVGAILGASRRIAISPTSCSMPGSARPKRAATRRSMPSATACKARGSTTRAPRPWTRTCSAKTSKPREPSR